MEFRKQLEIQNLQPRTPEQIRALRRQLRIFGIGFIGFGICGFFIPVSEVAPRSLWWLVSIIGAENVRNIFLTLMVLLGMAIFGASFMKVRYPPSLKKMR
ncbi:hypothetical protein ACFQPC_04425 [Herminiimonas glaciei]|uniref:Holin (3TMs family) n=1 Tax=Herminiimonas glaciei TaxID=523788 RepID=A0ABW2I8F1_9BURK